MFYSNQWDSSVLIRIVLRSTCLKIKLNSYNYESKKQATELIRIVKSESSEAFNMFHIVIDELDKGFHIAT